MYTFAFFAFLPFGNLLAGVIAEHHGLEPALLAMGGGLIAAAVAALMLSAAKHLRLE